MHSDNLVQVKDDMIAFIAGNGLRCLNAYVPEDVPSVMFEEDSPDAWKDFVEHAKATNIPFLTMSEVVLEKADIETLIERTRVHRFPDEAGKELDDAQYLLKFVGKTGYLQLGFAYGGVMFLHEMATDWYDRYQQWMEAVTDLGSIVLDDSDEE
jgi:hypothetical protein